MAINRNETLVPPVYHETYAPSEYDPYALSNQPGFPTPNELIRWFNLQNDPFVINKYLTALRNADYGKRRFNLDDPADAIVHALTTRRLGSVKIDDLNRALLAPGNVIQIIQFIVEAIKLIIDYLRSRNLCKFLHNDSNEAHQAFLNKLTALNGTNPFITLAGIHLEPKSILDLKNVNWRFVNLSHAHLENLDLTGAKLQHVNLRGAKLKNVRLDGADLTGANLDWVDLTQTNIVIGSFTLDSYLKTKYPANIVLSRIPTIDEFTNALSRILFEFGQEKKFDSVHRRYQRAEHLTMLTDNILKISNTIPNREHNIQFLKAALNHPLYQHHCNKSHPTADKLAARTSGLFSNVDCRFVNRAKLQQRLKVVENSDLQNRHHHCPCP